MQPTQDEVTKAVRRAMGPYGMMTSAEEVASLTEELTIHGQRYVARAQSIRHAYRVQSALADWDDLTSHGPQEDIPLGGWNYARALARVIRVLHDALLEEEQRLRFVGRTSLPPFVEGAL
ncbi:DUF6415 family natural product biosynthesis protein [Streptomyces sp. NBC_01565]|uniref:DUF6415 family natural product biosynthesis protein n=1 Tax=unclassified Streptomyces TaxID=2593676 RepID=UPI00225BFF42|nr:DUF6415 family natural product biosynthesis protein [Streptomyces sp. NBC_01565]MCX4546511.1 DUF6415 family natural product biosynthesis protein [Streptomyces sp. NBC_01565]